MTQHRRRKGTLIPLVVGNEPTLWRFNSVQAALSQHTDLIAQLILAGARVRRNAQVAPLPPVSGTHLRDGAGEVETVFR